MTQPRTIAMNDAGSLMRIRVRRATVADGDAVRSFTQGTFEGWDYIADVWDAWLAARDGVVFAAELADTPGRAVAIGRLALLSPTEAWMEGLRVDPAVRGHGVATTFQHAELAWAQEQASVVRYATGETNDASLRLGAKHGFTEAGRWRAVRPDETDPSNVHATGAGETGMVAGRETILERLARAGVAAASVVAREGEFWDRLADDATFRAAKSLYEWRAWAWQALTRARLAGHLRRGDALLAADGDAWALGLLAHERMPGETRLALLGGDPAMALRLVREVTGAAERRPTLRLPDPSPLLDGVGPQLAGDGWRIGEHVLVLMARDLRDASGRVPPLPDEGSDRVDFVEEPRPLGLVPAG